MIIDKVHSTRSSFAYTHCSHLELAKVQDEIVTLRQVLGAKLKRENELKTLLGVGFVDDLKQDWNETVHDIKSTTAYQKTAETLQAASDKITPVVQTVNTSLKSRLGSLKSKRKSHCCSSKISLL